VDAWARQPSEGEEAFLAFSIYRDLGPGQRSITKVAQECHKQRALIGRWSSRHEWLQRVAAYDQMVDQAKVSAQVQEVVEMHKRHASIAMRGQQLVLQWMQHILDAGGQIPDRVAARLFVEAPRLERVARGSLAIEEGTAGWEPTSSVSLGELFMFDGGARAELAVARLVVEQDPDDDGEDWDDLGEEEEREEPAAADTDLYQPEPVVHAVEAEPVRPGAHQPEEPVLEVAELPAVVNGDRRAEPIGYVWEDGQRVARYRDPPVSSPIQSAHPRRPRRRRRR
jgi:hypothetical protein